MIELNQIFGSRVVIGGPIHRNKMISYLCRCGCGKESYVTKYDLLKGRANGCHSCHNRAKMQNIKPENHPAWKGGRTIDNDGYILLTKPSHPSAGSRGRIFEHRFVMEEHLGRQLTKQETIHHKNGNRQDNRIENLELWSKSQPYGQRVDEKISWAIEILQQYAPELLR
jgi:hypothetical protein